jgi:integrase
MKLIRRKGKADLPGSIYRPKYRDKNGDLVESLVYWVKYYKDGKPLRESTKTTDYDGAVTFLADRVADVTKGKTPNIKLNRIRFKDLSEDFLSDYRINEKKSLKRAEASVSHLKAYFGNMLVIELDTSKVRKYIEHRSETKEVEGDTMPGAAKATINRELSALKRMLNLGAQCTPPKVDRVPHIPMLKENNIRKGFFEHSDFTALRNNLPDHLKPVATFGYVTGWRISEILSMEWSQVDRKNGIVRLDPGDTKNDDARTIYLDEELKEEFEKLWERRKELGTALPNVFLRMTKKGVKKIEGFRKAWMSACKAAEIGPRKFHDFRRTAVRNMVRAEIPDVVAMKISGHRTRSVFDRYNIVSDRDLQAAAQKQREYLDSQTGKEMGKVADLSRQKSKRATAN